MTENRPAHIICCRAQIINFLILVGLLRWLLYGPIVRAMTERERKIADRLSEAGQARTEAEQQKNDYEQKLHDIDHRRSELLADAKQEANEQRSQLTEQARRDVDKRRNKWEETFHRDQQEKSQEIRREMAKMGIAAARQTLAQLATADLETQMYREFIRRMSDLDDSQRDQVRQQFEDSQNAILVRSAFEMSDEDKQRLRDSIANHLVANADVQFERDEELICGLELDAGGYSFSWNANEFLKNVDREVSERVKTG